MIDGDEFGGTNVDTTKWGLYNSPGHNGKGLRRPSQITAGGGNLTITRLPDGTTGGMAMKNGRQLGRWEARMQVPAGDVRYHPVLILWPDAEDFPMGGEVDFAEATAAASTIDFFLHYGASNSQTHAAAAADLTGWHNYAVEWTQHHIRGYLDGVQYFEDTVATHQPPAPCTRPSSSTGSPAAARSPGSRRGTSRGCGSTTPASPDHRTVRVTR